MENEIDFLNLRVYALVNEDGTYDELDLHPRLEKIIDVWNPDLAGMLILG